MKTIILSMIFAALSFAQVTVTPTELGFMVVYNNTDKPLVATYFEIIADGVIQVPMGKQGTWTILPGGTVDAIINYTGQVTPSHGSNKIQENYWQYAKGKAHIGNMISLFSDHTTQGLSTWDITLMDQNIQASQFHLTAYVTSVDTGGPQDPSLMKAIDYDNHHAHTFWQVVDSPGIAPSPDSYTPPAAVISYNTPITCMSWGQEGSQGSINKFNCTQGFRYSYPAVLYVYDYTSYVVAYLSDEEGVFDFTQAGGDSGTTAGIWPPCFGVDSVVSGVYTIINLAANCDTGGDISAEIYPNPGSVQGTTFVYGMSSYAYLETSSGDEDVDVEVGQYWNCSMYHPDTITGNGPCPDRIGDSWSGGAPNGPL